MKVPYDALSPEALEGVVDEFILREGTDYGDFPEGQAALTLEAKRSAVIERLKRGEAELWFDAETESTTLREPDQ